MDDGEVGCDDDCNWEVRLDYLQKLSFYSPWQHRFPIAGSQREPGTHFALGFLSLFQSMCFYATLMNKACCRMLEKELDSKKRVIITLPFVFCMFYAHFWLTAFEHLLYFKFPVQIFQLVKLNWMNQCCE